MSLANKFNIPPALFETIKKMNEGNAEYQAKVKALMAKRGIKSLGDLSPEEKKDFFNTLDSMHKAKNEEVELEEGQAGAEKFSAEIYNKAVKSKKHIEIAPNVHFAKSKSIYEPHETSFKTPSGQHGYASHESEGSYPTLKNVYDTLVKNNPHIKDTKALKDVASAVHAHIKKNKLQEEIKLDEAIPKSTNYALVHSSSKKIIAKGNKAEMMKKMKELNAKEKGSHYLGMTNRGKVGDTFGEEVELEEGKSSTGYELYHKDFSSAMQHAYDFAKKKYNIEIDPLEIDRNVAMGPRKPSSGKANAYRLLDKTGKKAIQVQVANLDNKRYELNMYKEEVELDEVSPGLAKKVAQARDRSAVANRLTPTQSRRLKMKDSGGEPFMNAAQALKSAMKRGAKNVYGEEVEEIDELKVSTLTRYGTKATQAYGRNPEKDEKRQQGIQRARAKVQQKTMKKEEIELTESHFKVGQRVECIKSGMKGTVVKVDKPEVGKYYTVRQDSGKMMKYAPDELKAISDKKVEEASSPAQQAAIAIAMKKAGKTPKNMKEEQVMVCKDCGDEFGKPTTDCPYDSRDPQGENWVKKEMNEVLDTPSKALGYMAKATISGLKSGALGTGKFRKRQAGVNKAIQKTKAKIAKMNNEEVEELDEGMSAAQIKTLRDAYAKIDKIDVSGQPYKNLVAFLDKQDIKTLKMLAGAKIKFISGMAQNRVVRKMNEDIDESIGSTVGGALGQYAGSKMGLEGPGRVHGEVLGRKLEMFARAILKKLTKEEIELDEEETKEFMVKFEKQGKVSVKNYTGKSDLDVRSKAKVDAKRMGMTVASVRLKEEIEEASDPQKSMKRASLSVARAQEVIRHRKEIGTIRKKREALRNSFDPTATVLEAYKKSKMKKEATAKDKNKSVNSGDKLSGKSEPIEIDPELKEQKT